MVATSSMLHPERSIFPWNWAHYPENENEVFLGLKHLLMHVNGLLKNKVTLFDINKAPNCKGFFDNLKTNIHLIKMVYVLILHKQLN